MDSNPNSANSDHPADASPQPVMPPTPPAAPGPDQSAPQAPMPPQPMQAPVPPQQPAQPMAANPYAVPQSGVAAGQPGMPVYATPGATPVPAPGENQEKNYLLALAFSFLIGSFGIDRFYLGYIGTGILKLITFGGFGIWHFIDLMLIAFGKLKEKGNPAPLEGYTKYHHSIKPVAILLLVIDVLMIVGFFLFVLFMVVLGAASNNSPDYNPYNASNSTSQSTLYSN